MGLAVAVAEEEGSLLSSGAADEAVGLAVPMVEKEKGSSSSGAYEADDDDDAAAAEGTVLVWTWRCLIAPLLPGRHPRCPLYVVRVRVQVVVVI